MNQINKDSKKQLILGSGIFSNLVFNELNDNFVLNNFSGFWDNYEINEKKINHKGFKIFSDVSYLHDHIVFIGISLQNNKGPNFIRERYSFLKSCKAQVSGFCFNEKKSKKISNLASIFRSAFLDYNCEIEKLTVIRPRSYIGHDSYIGECCYIAPNATIGAFSHLECNIFVGYGALVLPKIKIGKNSLISAGAIVNKDVAENSIVKRDGQVLTVKNPFKFI